MLFFFSDIERHVEETKDNLGQKEAEIANLTERLQQQSASYEREVAELTIQRMQDAYINRVLDGDDSHKRQIPTRHKDRSARQRRF